MNIIQRTTANWYDIYSDDTVPPYEYVVIGRLLKLPDWDEYEFQAAKPPAGRMLTFTAAELTTILETLQKLNRDGHLSPMEPPAESAATELPFSLQASGDERPLVTGRVVKTPHSIAVYCDGYGHFNMADGHGAVVGLSVDSNGEPEVNVWGDITQEDATHWESLAGASERLRLAGTETIEG